MSSRTLFKASMLMLMVNITFNIGDAFKGDKFSMLLIGAGMVAALILGLFSAYENN